MGCSSSAGESPLETPTSSREEKIIKSIENSLPFTQKPVREQVNTFRLNSFSGYLNQLQLTRAINDLSWTSFLNSKHSCLSTLINLLNTQEKTPVLHLCFLSILLGKGTTEGKAEIFYNLIDSEANGFINEKNLVSALKDLFDLSVIYLPRLAINLGVLTETEYDSYIYQYKEKQTSAIFLICDQVLAQRLKIDFSDFLKSVKELKLLSSFFDTSAIRHFLINSQVSESEENYLKGIESGDSSKELDRKIVLLPDPDPESPTLNYTSSDSDEFSFKEETKIIKQKKIEVKIPKPPRPVKCFKNSEPNSPLFSLQDEKEGQNRERWKNNGEIKTVKKLRCSSLRRSCEKVVLKYQMNGKVVEIELRDYEDPIKVAYNFSVKNNLGKRERNNIAVMLSRLQMK